MILFGALAIPFGPKKINSLQDFSMNLEKGRNISSEKKLASLPRLFRFEKENLQKEDKET
ncbi:hypothetical protein J22TS1_00740 [Siminovitchia terrae]|nr:hypothetical protein J22TS1_00740 [Siminovitchia terrae]